MHGLCMSILVCTMQTREIKISFIHIVQPMNESTADKLYFIEFQYTRVLLYVGTGVLSTKVVL